jgi:hypothetical protein
MSILLYTGTPYLTYGSNIQVLDMCVAGVTPRPHLRSGELAEWLGQKNDLMLRAFKGALDRLIRSTTSIADL